MSPTVFFLHPHPSGNSILAQYFSFSTFGFTTHSPLEFPLTFHVGGGGGDCTVCVIMRMSKSQLEVSFGLKGFKQAFFFYLSVVTIIRNKYKYDSNQLKKNRKQDY